MPLVTFIAIMDPMAIRKRGPALSMQLTWISREPVRAMHSSVEAPLLFTIATLVSDGDQYQEMLQSFDNGGFTTDCEYLAIDNRDGNSIDAYEGIQLFLERARGRYVVICHQDVRLIAEGRRELLACLADLEFCDVHWAMAGNAGATDKGLAIRISDPHGEDQRVGDLPARALSLDENFLVIKRSAMIAPSAGLKGFHLYGTDLCLQALMQGRGTYVIDFHLRHLGRGTIGLDYYSCLEALEDKYVGVLNLGFIQTTCLAPMITGSYWRLALARLRRWPKKVKKLRRERQAKAAGRR